jgi:alkylation response protein AidB-like acyl-CoA dehydrogenase
MAEIPAPILNVAAGAISACLLALAFWAIRQVRSAARVVSNDATLRQTLADQAALIIAQQLRIEELQRCLAAAEVKISDLTDIVRQMQLVEEVRPAKRAAATHPPTAGG